MSESAELSHQARKSLATQERILDAVVSIINEEGYAAASSKRICARSGMTWGAVQHHFGTKEDILAAVLEASHRQFNELMQNRELIEGGVEQRCDLFVDLMWKHYQRDLYMAALEILMASRGKQPPAAGQSQSAEHLATMRRVFPDSDLSDDELLEAMIFVHNLLTGMIIDRLFEGQQAREANFLAAAKQQLLQRVTAGSAE